MEGLFLIATLFVFGAPLIALAWLATLSGKQNKLAAEVRSLRAQLQRLTSAAPRAELSAAPRAELSETPAVERPELPLAPMVLPGLPREEYRAHLRQAEPALPTHLGAPEAEPRPARAKPERSAAPSSGGSAIDWERWLGVRGAAVVGGVALTLAGLFFVQLAIQRGWIGPAMRDGLAVGAGALALAAFGPLHRRGYKVQAAAIGGAGTVLVYVGAWAAARVHDIVPMWASFSVMTVTTAFALRLALRANAPLLAGFGLVGGFATPVLLDVGARSIGALFTYLAVLNLGALTAGRRRGWEWVPRVAVALSALVQLFWYARAVLIGEATHVPRIGALVAIGSIAFVYLFATARDAPASVVRRRVQPTVLVALALQVLFAIDLARTLSLDASLLPVGAFAVLLAVAAAYLARGFGEPTLALAGGVGGFALIAAWALRHPARTIGDVDQFTRLLFEYGGVALALAGALTFVERGFARNGRSAPASAATAAGLLVALGLLVVARPAWGSPWFVAVVAAGLAASTSLALTQAAARSAAWVVGAVCAVVVAQMVDPARSAALFHGTAFGAEAASALVALALVGGLLGRRSVRARRAGAGVAAAGLVALAAHGVGQGGTGDLPLAALLLTAAGLLNVLGPWRRSGARGIGDPWPTVSLIVATAFAGGAWLASLARSGELADWTQFGLLTLAAACVALGVAWRSGAERSPREASWGDLDARTIAACVAWCATLPTLVVFSPALRIIAEHAAWSHGRARTFAVACLPVLAGGVLALWRKERAVAGPMLAVAGLCTAFTLAYFVEVQPAIVGLGLGAAAIAFVGKQLGQRDVALVSVGVGLLAALVYLGAGLGGRTFASEAWFVAPRLAYVSAAVLVGLAMSWNTARRSALAIAVLVVTFLWSNLVVVNHYSDGAHIALRFARLPARDLALSFVWALYAGVLLALGQFRASRPLRWASLFFFIATVLKVFLFDLGALRGGYRAASFLGLAVALFSVSLVYQRWILPPATRRFDQRSPTDAQPGDGRDGDSPP
jgi:hypothetical protein